MKKPVQSLRRLRWLFCICIFAPGSVSFSANAVVQMPANCMPVDFSSPGLALTMVRESTSIFYYGSLYVIIPLLVLLAFMAGKKPKKRYMAAVMLTIILFPLGWMVGTGLLSMKIESDEKERFSAARHVGDVDDCGCQVTDRAQQARLRQTKPDECLKNQIEQTF